MTANEKELFDIIRNHPNPEQAVEIALNLAVEFLKMREAPQDTSSEHQRVSA